MWSPIRKPGGYFHGTASCLSALFHAGRHAELIALLDKAPFSLWHYREWGVRALAAMDRKAEAIRYAEASRGLNGCVVPIVLVGLGLGSVAAVLIPTLAVLRRYLLGAAVLAVVAAWAIYARRHRVCASDAACGTVGTARRASIWLVLASAIVLLALIWQPWIEPLLLPWILRRPMQLESTITDATHVPWTVPDRHNGSMEGCVMERRERRPHAGVQAGGGNGSRAWAIRPKPRSRGSWASA